MYFVNALLSPRAEGPGRNGILLDGGRVGSAVSGRNLFARKAGCEDSGCGKPATGNSVSADVAGLTGSA